MGSIVYLVTWNEMCHLRESVHNNKHGILSISSFRQAKYKIHANIFPGLIWNWKWHVKAMGLSFGLSFHYKKRHVRDILGRTIFFCHTYDTSMTIIVTKPGIIIDVVGSYFYDKKS